MEVVRTHSVQAEVETVLVESAADAAHLAYPGSPTVRVNGVDIEPTPPANIGLG